MEHKALPCLQGGTRGFMGSSTTRLLRDQGLRGKALYKAAREQRHELLAMAEEAIWELAPAEQG